MNVLYEIFVPTRFGDNNTPISTKHHRQWDKYVQSITGGLTVFAPARGKWMNEGIEYPERIIPVRVMCKVNLTPDVDDLGYECNKIDNSQFERIIEFTLKHYRQKAVMYFEVTRNVQIQYAK